MCRSLNCLHRRSRLTAARPLPPPPSTAAANRRRSHGCSFLVLVLSCNVLDLLLGALLGVEGKEVFTASWPRTLLNLELWRPLTSAVYLGPISMHWATNLYFLVQYGSHLEAVNG
jgi:Der1-like family